METVEQRTARIEGLEAARAARRGEDRMLTREDVPSAWIGDPLPGDLPPLSVREAERLPDVRACVGIYARTFALVPLRAWRETPEGLVPAGGRAADLLARPTSWQAPAAWRAYLGSTLARFGEAFVGLMRDQDGQIAELRLMDPLLFEVEVVDGEPVYTYSSEERGVLRLTRADVVHVIGPSSFDGVRGTSPIRECRELVGLVRAVLVHGLETFGGSAIPPAVLTVAAGPHADEQAENLDRAWHARKRGRVAVVTGEVNLQKLGFSNGEAEFLTTARWSSELVARAFGLPAAALGESTGGTLDYTNVEAMLKRMATLDLRPWLECAQDALSLNRELFPGGAVARFALGDTPLDPERGWGPDQPTSPETPSTNGRTVHA